VDNKKRPEQCSGRCSVETVYFFGVQVAQLAQSVLPSAQQAMPQVDFLPQQAQPVAKAATHRVRARTLMSFMF
jgi:hypothetical protein